LGRFALSQHHVLPRSQKAFRSKLKNQTLPSTEGTEMLVSSYYKVSKLMQDELDEIDNSTKRRLQSLQRTETAFLPSLSISSTASGADEPKSAAAANVAKEHDIEDAAKGMSRKGQAKDVGNYSENGKRKIRLREELEIEDAERSHKRHRPAFSAAAADHQLSLSQDIARQAFSRVLGRPTTMGTFESQVPLLQFQHPSLDRADFAIGLNAARNAAMFASLSNQAQVGMTHSRFDPYLLASSRLGAQPWQLGNRFASVASHGLFSHGTPLHSGFHQFAEQEHAALLRLNAMQANSSFLEGQSRLGVSLNNPFYRTSLPGSFIRLPPNTGAAVSAALFGNAFGITPVSGPELSASSMAMEANLPAVQDLLATSDSGSGRDTIQCTLLPPDDGVIAPFHQRPQVPLATDEDQNWLSEFLCFVRLELVEIFRANQEDVRSRNSSKKVLHGQVGIRCRYCAHLPLSSRASRSSSYPSSLSRIYQSLTMMLRDHFGKCDAIPPPLKQRFLELKGKTSQGATDSKHYWVYSATKRGLLDSESGIRVREGGSQSVATEIHPIGITEARVSTFPATMTSLVTPDDRLLVSEFLYTLMTQVQRVNMEESERTGNRKSLAVGLPGIGCRHCCQSNRKGLCRLFPVRRRTLPNKINDLYEHIRRCTLCPAELKEHLVMLRQRDGSKEKTAGEKELFDRIWVRMGHGADHIEN
jgi:hypothetical protein